MSSPREAQPLAEPLQRRFRGMPLLLLYIIERST
jgi:hypothetical protein